MFAEKDLQIARITIKHLADRSFIEEINALIDYWGGIVISDGNCVWLTMINKELQMEVITRSEQDRRCPLCIWCIFYYRLSHRLDLTSFMISLRWPSSFWMSVNRLRPQLQLDTVMCHFDSYKRAVPLCSKGGSTSISFEFPLANVYFILVISFQYVGFYNQFLTVQSSWLSKYIWSPTINLHSWLRFEGF